MTEIEDAILRRLRDLASARVRVHRLIAFGSRARGDADPESDLDVAVILEDPVDAAIEEFISTCAWEAGFDEGVVVCPVVYGRAEWEGIAAFLPLARAIVAEGVPR